MPPSTVEGEVAAETQPFPTKPAPFARQLLTEDMLTNATPEAHQWALEQFRTFRSDGQFVPFAVGKETVIFPGFDGGAEWGGSAFDPGDRSHLRQRERHRLDVEPARDVTAGEPRRGRPTSRSARRATATTCRARSRFPVAASTCAARRTAATGRRDRSQRPGPHAGVLDLPTQTRRLRSCST